MPLLAYINKNVSNCHLKMFAVKLWGKMFLDGVNKASAKYENEK